ncbi:hypothetical protein [Nannocystis pusilla]|uniref:hypothetical protein n=1 Tax=Nannocystis pusilla TaxID=889268 RepID=UPI003DA3EA94
MVSRSRCASCLLALAACAWLPACDEADASCAALADEGLLVTAYIDHNGKQARTEIEVRRVDDDAGLSLALCKRSSLTVDGTAATRVRRPSGSYVYKVDGVDRAKDGGTVTHELKLVDDDYEATYRVSVEAPAFEITAPKAGAKLPRTQAFERRVDAGADRRDDPRAHRRRHRRHRLPGRAHRARAAGRGRGAGGPGAAQDRADPTRGVQRDAPPVARGHRRARAEERRLPTPRRQPRLRRDLARAQVHV